LEIENLGKRSGITDVSVTNKIQEIEEKFSHLEEIDTTVKENSKGTKLLTQSIQVIQDLMERPNLRLIVIEEDEDSQLKGREYIFNKIIEENFF
jgi:archaeosine-15-forming tRNA-guanine transglycosylase